MRLSSVFKVTTVPYGDDGKTVRGIICNCAHPGCEAAIPLPVNVMATGGNETDAVAFKFIARKLEARNWRIGARSRDHRCPRHAEKNAMTSPLQLVKDTMTTPPRTTPLPPKDMAPAPIALTARTMTRDDRRIIFEKLNEVYVNDKVGYDNGWSDEKVATDLGVPRHWVTLIRDENFGDELTSENVRLKIKEAHELVAKIKQYNPTLAEMQKLVSLADRMEKELADIAKVMK